MSNNSIRRPVNKISLSNHKLYAGNGIMQTDVTNIAIDANNEINKLQNNAENNRTNNSLDITDKYRFIDTGILYSKSINGQIKYQVFKYGSRKLPMKAPAQHLNRYTGEYPTFNVILPDLCFVYNSTHSDIYMSMILDESDCSKSNYWPFHNVYAREQRIIRGYELPTKNDALRDLYFQNVCTGYSVSGINFSKTPELYVHTLLTAKSNYDLSSNILHCKRDVLINVLKEHDYFNKDIDLSKVSNVLTGVINFSDVFENTESTDASKAIVHYLFYNKCFRNNEYFASTSSDIPDSSISSEYRNNKDTRYMLVAAILSYFDDLNMMNDYYLRVLSNT